MKKSEIFTFTASNGDVVTAIVIDKVRSETFKVPRSSETVTTYLCYAQKRLFYYIVHEETTKYLKEGVDKSWEEGLYYDNVPSKYTYDITEQSESIEVLVDYCIIPEFDSLLRMHQEQTSTEEEEEYFPEEPLDYSLKDLEELQHQLDMADDYASKKL